MLQVLFPVFFLVTGFICCGTLNSNRVVQAPCSEVGNVIPFNQESIQDCSYTNPFFRDIAVKLAVVTKIHSKRPLGIKQ